MPIRGPKVKVARALNLAITPKSARIMEKRSFPPGQHGLSRRRSPSVYKQQLVEKQRLKALYNVSEKQLRKAYQEASRLTGTTGELMLQRLETRADALVLRAGFAATIFAARQYVAHGHFMHNGKRIYTPSIQLKVGDVLEVRERSKTHPQMVESIGNSPEAPNFLEVNKVKMIAKLIAKPNRDQIAASVNEQLIVEFYSR
jgi:small subunit ribosomal protein S4